MLRRISVLLLSALLTVGLTANVALAQPANRDDCVPDSDELLCDKGQPGSDEEKVPGSPTDPNAWGSVVTQTAIQSEGDFGEHASDPPGDEPRDGFGNVSRNDAGNEGPDAPDTGDHIADHACIADDPFQADCEEEPGSTAPRGA
jgi:hypothetical protein